MANTTEAFIRDNFDSISEGCFLIMPEKKRQRKNDQPVKMKRSRLKSKNIKIAHRTEENTQQILYEGFQQLFGGEESLDAMLYRKKSFEECWRDVNEIANNILLDMNQAAIQAICDFVNKEHDIDKSLISLPFHEIPTGLVFAGINTPDHDMQFAHIAERLQEPNIANNNKKNYVSLLQSKDCLNIKNMLKTMIERFLANTPTEFNSENMYEENEHDENDLEDDEDIIQPESVAS
ncbi:MAG: origin recognition complex subunit 3 N-terminus-domain-containing protein [Benjaminiella poitrasii]|nr:MAG: origin recognition complex subunit 3 N-terminus-domain-containing protein [Benjaminiella poitrasii]